ncbi:MAG: hypothetical protein J7576_23380 [Siphonobacter aquaeclarae]|nr:hypothetical protein [Siphonobacter aquaeclarae]
MKKILVLTLAFLLGSKTISHAQKTYQLTYDPSGNRLTKKQTGSSPNPAVVANPAAVPLNQPSTLTATGCTGTVKWSNGQQGASITVTPGQTTQYTAECVTPNCPNNGIGHATVEVYQCQPDNLGITSTLYNTRYGQSVTLTVYGCPGSVQWSNGQTGFTISPEIYGASTTYTATCSRRNCPNSGTASVAIGGVTGCNTGDVLVTAQAGNWNTPATWACGRIPTATDVVYLVHDVQVNANASARNIVLGTGSLRYLNNSVISLVGN